MKRVISMLLVVTMLLSMTAFTASADTAAEVLTSGTDVVASAASPVVYTWTAASNGTLTVTMGKTSPGWSYTITDASGNTVGLPKSGSTEKSADFELVKDQTYTFTATGFSTSTWDVATGPITYTLSFVPAEDSGVVEVAEYEVSDAALAMGSNSVTMLDTAVTTIFVFEPEEAAEYTFTGPEGSVVGYWGAGSWFLSNPGNTTNSCTWTCSSVGQSAYIGISGVTGTVTVNVEKTGEYVDNSIQYTIYENVHTPVASSIACYKLAGAVYNVNESTALTLGQDGFYYTADGSLVFVNFTLTECSISAMLGNGAARYVQYYYDEEGNIIGHANTGIDYTNALMAYTDVGSFYPLTEDLYQALPQLSEIKGWVTDNYLTSWTDLLFTCEPAHTEGEAVETDGFMVTSCTVCGAEISRVEIEVTEPEDTEPEATEPVSGQVLLNDKVTASSGSKYVYSYTPAEDGTLTITIGDGSTNWAFDLRSVVGLTFTAISSGEGSAQTTYTAEVSANTKYQIRVWNASGGALADTPVMVVFTPAGGAVEPEVTEPEVTEPEVTEPEATEPEASEPEITEPSDPQPTEPVDPDAPFSVTNQAVTASGYTYTYTAETSGTLHVSVGECSPGWRYKVISPDGVESSYRSQYTAGKECDYHNVAGNWKIIFYAYSSVEADNVDGTVSFTVTFTPDEVTGETEPTEPEKKPYEVSTTKLVAGVNNLTMLDTAEATIFKFTPTEVGTYTFTAPEGALAGIWGYSSSYLNNPNSTSNTVTWTCANVGPSVFIGVSGVEGAFVLKVETDVQPTEPEVTEPEVTEPTDPEPTEPEPTVPSIPDEDVPAGTYYSITVDGNTTYYSSSSGSALNQNLKKITGSAYVKFYQDMTLGSSYTVDVYNGNITLDLNGCTITSEFKGAGCLYVDGGNVILVDTSADGSGLLQNTSTGFGIEVYSGSVTMLSGNAQGVQGAKVWAAASFEMQGGTVSGNNYGINALADSAVTISGGEIIQLTTGSFKYALYAASTATMKITDGYFNGAISGSGLNGKISGGYFTTQINTTYVASGCELQENEDAVYLWKVYDPNAVPEEPEPTEPEPTETEPTEPEPTETEPTEPEPTEPEPTVTEPSEPEPSEEQPSEPETTEPVSGVITSGTNVAATAAEPIIYTWTAEADGTLTVTMGAATPGWRFTVSNSSGETVGLPKSGKTEMSVEYMLTAGETYTFRAVGFNSASWDEVSANLTYTLTFQPAETGGEVEMAEYEVSETALVLGNNTLTLLETAVTTIYVFEPAEMGVYTFTAPAGAILGYWGAGSWFLSDPGSTTNTYEWTCTGVGQSAYIGVSGAEGSFNLNVEKTGEYEVVVIPTVVYENKAPLSAFTLPEGSKLGSYIDVTSEEVFTAVLGEDGYYHLNSADGDIILVDLDYQDIILSAALQSDRPVMYAYTTDEDGNQVKYDIGNAVLEYEKVMDANGYYPLTEDLILFYDVYGNGAGIYTFHISGSYNADNAWMYCMRTVQFPEEPESVVDRWNLVLDDDLLVNFYVNAEEGAQVQVSFAGETVTYATSDLQVADDGKYIVPVRVSAAQMTEAITVQIVGSDAEAESYTVRQYANAVLADSELSAYHALIREMLNYGGAAQTYFQYNTENMANADIADAGEASIPEAADEMVVTDASETVGFYGAAMVYRDKIAVRFYFSGDISGCTFTDANGNSYTAAEKDGKYYVEIADILPQDMDQQLTLTVTDADGSAVSVTYGPMNYIVRMNAKGSDSLKALLKALYNYHLAAKELRTAV